MNENEAQLKLFRALLDQSNDAIEVVDPKTLRFLDVNEKACHDLGYSRQELLNLRVFDIDPSIDEFLAVKVLDELNKSGFLVMETCHRRKDGSVFPVEVSIKRVLLDRPYVVTVARDITERKRVEDACIRSAAIVESSDDAIIGTDASGTITDWNKGAERVFGYSAEEAIGRNVSFLSPEDRPEDGQRILEKVLSGEAVKNYEAVRRRKDGTRIEMSITLSRTVDATGRVVGASGIGRDITERKRAERELLQTNERLNLCVEAGRIAEWEADIKNGKSFWFGQTHAMLGIDPEVHSASTEEFWNRVHPEDRG